VGGLQIRNNTETLVGQEKILSEEEVYWRPIWEGDKKREMKTVSLYYLGEP
jgi:hypothetical protein